LAGFEVTLYGRFWVTPEAADDLANHDIEAVTNRSSCDCVSEGLLIKISERDGTAPR